MWNNVNDCWKIYPFFLFFQLWLYIFMILLVLQRYKFPMLMLTNDIQFLIDSLQNDSFIVDATLNVNIRQEFTMCVWECVFLDTLRNYCLESKQKWENSHIWSHFEWNSCCRISSALNHLNLKRSSRAFFKHPSDLFYWIHWSVNRSYALNTSRNKTVSFLFTFFLWASIFFI